MPPRSGRALSTAERCSSLTMSFGLPPNHYRLSSQSYGGFTFDSIGRATGPGASTEDPLYPPLNGPPSAVFLPHGAGKTVGQNGRTVAFPGQYTFGQNRTSTQKVLWTPAMPTYGASSAGTSLAYQAKAATWDLTELFRQFDADHDGYLTIAELKRAFRAIGLKKRKGHKAQMDLDMFKSFDSNGDGKITPEEFDANLPHDVRAKIEEKLNGGFVFDKKQWEASAAKLSHWDMAKVFKQFDSDGSGYLSMDELQRAFRAIGLPKRSGEKLELDAQMFKQMDTDGNGMIDVQEFEHNLPDDVREKLEEKLNGGWEFDPQKWAESQSRNA